VPKPEPGRIILAETFDPQKRNAKIRPAVIVSRTDQIQAEGRIVCAAITSAIPDKLPDDCVLLPFHPAGKSRTGLRMRSAAMCSWLFEITEEKIEKYIGIVPPARLDEVLARIEELKRAKQ
jgi:mRNA-degrading endonuclease toxin of MazEF toxin-antitoxin module